MENVAKVAPPGNVARPLPSKKTLENYAISYMGAYLNTVRTERPDRLPVLARNQFHEIEVCLMPNNCLAMLFEKAEKMSVTVNERDWNYVESKVMSGVTHLVAVYSHEGMTVADAIIRGKRDAVRDIRSVEDSNIAKAVTDLEKIVDGLGQIEQSNKGTLGLGEAELARLRPIKDAIMTSGPEVDMLAILDALKSSPAVPNAVGTDSKDRQLLQKMAQDVGDLSDVIRRVEDQDKKVQEIEKSLTKALSEYNRNIDERISKGLAVILQASDKKIDKGLAVVKNTGAHGNGGLPKDLELRLEKVDKAIGAIHMRLQDVAGRKPSALQLPPDLELRLDGLEKAAKAVDLMVHELFNKPGRGSEQKDDKAGIVDELVFMVGDLKDNVARLNARLMKIEEFLLQMQMQGAAPKRRILKRKL
jgi:hypothetical protein